MPHTKPKARHSHSCGGYGYLWCSTLPGMMRAVIIKQNQGLDTLDPRQVGNIIKLPFFDPGCQECVAFAQRQEQSLREMRRREIGSLSP